MGIVLLNFNEEDHRKAEILRKQETIDYSSKEAVFKGMVYAILSGSENFPNQIRTYNGLCNAGICNPVDLSHVDLSPWIKDKSKSSKKKLLKEFSIWWDDSLYERILSDINTGRNDGKEIRQFLVKNAPGLSYKCASLTMNMLGYENFGVLDIWAIRALVDDDNYRPFIKSYKFNPHKSDIPISENNELVLVSPVAKKYSKRRTKHTSLGYGMYLDRGVGKKEYPIYEPFFIEKAHRMGYKTLQFKHLLHVKNSTWGKSNILDQLTLEDALNK